MNLDNIVYSTKPQTLGEKILGQRAGRGDFEAMAGYILSRTSLTQDEVLDLDDDDLIVISGKILDAVLTALMLQQIGKTLDA